ncbi:MAG: Mut7-C RNAse domain-containing protein [Deltaproteobacteria bacterium]|nr:Mut7-C RNAse domain-containing protein [Deltaproteobacteria bacterium]MDZ4347683.1 Mut7-C RNAse domain-containing protein [Candidatus Binatia bacterium]
MAAPISEQVQFAADRMLGRLARWLRVLGQDVIYGRHLSGYGLIRAARAENRLILTRDRGLKQKQPPPFIFIDSNDYREQLRQVIRECGLRAGDALFTRCLECNAVLQPKSKESVESLVPPYVFSTQEMFFWCSQCRRVYWPATHHQKMLEELRIIGVL